MAYKQIASGSIFDAYQLASYERELKKGDKGLLEVDLRFPVSQGVADELQRRLINAGVSDAKVTTHSPLMRIYWKEASPGIGIIAAIVLGLILLFVLIVGWRFFKDVVEAGGPVMLWGIIAVVAVIGVVILTRRRKG